MSVRVVFDGVEFVERLWFADESWDDLGLPGTDAQEIDLTEKQLHTLIDRLATFAGIEE